jgi:hypothetical protein
VQHDLNISGRNRGVDTGADLHRGQVRNTVRAERIADALCERLRTGAVNAGQQHDELFASETRGDIDVSTLVGEQRANPSEDQVTRLMSPSLVNDLEPVQIKRRDRDRSPLPPGVGEFDRGALIKPTAIQQPGQQIGPSLVVKTCQQQFVSAFEDEPGSKPSIRPATAAALARQRVMVTGVPGPM